MMISDTEKVISNDLIENVEDEQFTAAEQRKIIRRVDFRLIAMLGLVYSIQLMDRSNVGMAAIAG